MKKVSQYIFETKYINGKIIIEVIDIEADRRPVMTITAKSIPDTLKDKDVTKTIQELCNFLNILFWRLR